MCKKILIVEDVQEVRELLGIALSKSGFDILQAESGKEGVELARQGKPDLILLDAMMYDLGGIEVIKKIKEFDRGVKIIMLSGLDSEELKEEAHTAGALNFLCKSLGVEAIVKEITDIL